MPGSPESRPAGSNERVAPSQAPADALAKAFELFRAPPRIPTADYIESAIVLPGDVSDQAGPMELFPYQRGICEAVDDPATPQITWQKCARIGATSIMIGIVANFVKNNPRNVLMFQPRLEDARDFCLLQLDSVFAASPSLRGLLAQNKKKHATIQSRVYPGGWFRCVNAVADNTKRRLVHVLILDECDSYPPSPEGNILTLAIDRTRTVRDRLIFQASTPTDVETSSIARAYAQSDMRIYEIECPGCGDYFEPKWEHVAWDKDSNGADLPDTAHLVCPHNGCIIQESSKAAAVKAGRWRATAPHVKGHAGFKCSALISTIEHAKWSQIVREYLEAKDDPASLRSWTNTLMGETFQGGAGEGLDEHTLMKRAEPFGLSNLPAEVRCLVAGADVQKYGCEVVVLGFSETENEIFVLSYDTIHGDPTKDKLWNDLDSFLRQRFASPIGGTLGIDSCAVDSGNWSEDVYKFTYPRWNRGIVSVKGKDTGPIIKKSPNVAGLFMIGDHASKTRLFELLEKPGRVRFSHDLEARYYEELTNEERHTLFKSGQYKHRWERIKGSDNEALDATRYAFAVKQITRVDMQQRSNELRGVAPPAKPMQPAYRFKIMGNR